MGKLIDLTGLSEFKTKLLNLINPQLVDTVKTVNSKSATNHAVNLYASDIAMSSSDTTKIPNKLKEYVRTVNGTAPDPITGDVVVAGGGGDSSVGLLRRSIGIAVSDWSGSGPYTFTYQDEDIAVGMCVLEAYLSDEYAQLGINSYTIQNGSLVISTTVKPTDNWILNIALGMDGSSFMEDVSDLKSKVGNGTLDTQASTLIGGVNELTAEIANKQDELTFDSSPTAGSSNPVTSGGVYTAFQNVITVTRFDLGDPVYQGQSYNNIFTDLPNGTYILILNYASDAGGLITTNSTYLSSIGDITNKGGSAVYIKTTNDPIQFYVNTDDTSLHTFYRFKITVIKIK